MSLPVTAARVQGESRFPNAKSELRNSIIAEGGMLVSRKNSVK